MNPDVFNKIRKIVHDQSGIHIKDGKMSMVSARIRKRLRQLQLADEKAYLDYLKQHAEEMVQLLNVISTNTTHFYREAAHFDFLSQMMRQWSQAGQDRFRVWCAAASTGEEPYTIAITLNETFSSLGRRPDMRILATDISTRVLDQCKVGVYQERQFENMPSAIKKKYFRTQKSEGEPLHAVRDDLKKMILFARLNLNEPPFPMKGPMDIVFCRNVMIYFDATTKARLVKEIHRLLKPGGYLLISHTESLTGISQDYEAVGASIYRKPEHAR